MASTIQTKTISVDGGIEVFYREAYPSDSSAPSFQSTAIPVILLLHGFPTSSFQYRDLIPILAKKYRVIAPDLPGYGFTVVPEERSYKYSFEFLTNTIAAFVDALQIKKFTVYVFDYGAPTGLRLALQRPDAVTAIISQNGNAYVEGLGEAFWADARKAWADPSPENLDALKGVTTFETVKWQYVTGAPNASAIPPETYTLDYYLMTRPGNAQIQLDLLLDYKSNVELYPSFHHYFRQYQPPVLAIWGKNDQIFIPAGAEAYKRDNPNAIVKFVDAGHFALESALEEISAAIMSFLEHHGE
ncbi:alpha/beta hydrolase fold protein [Earliella scabrosa]|nr:alpha/beta hydrolase fold protein [Earliella scabrosa]